MINMKKNLKNIITMMCLLAITTAWAGPVSESQARNIAAQFMASHAMQSTNLRVAQRAPRMGEPASDSQAAYYVFNAGRSGYVIVAGDDRVPAILGYSDNGTFDSQDVPEAMQELLNGYAAQIEAIDHGAEAALHLSNKPAIAPLISAQWAQRAPYNIRIPFINGKHAPVGCVATAMAQIMHYWKWPARPTSSIPAYTTETKNIYMPLLPAVDFEWNNMRNTYETSDTLSAAGQSVATLALYCAQSLSMDFTPNGSSAYSRDIPNALINYFGYKPSAKYIRRIYYSTQNWEETLYNELAARRPVAYRGSKASGSHAFICDGYDGNGMFHFNWGWNGSSNGYFLLNVLNPDIQGVGSADEAYGYIMDQAMVTGIEPGTTPGQLVVTDRLISIESSNLSRTSQNAYFSMTVLTHFLNTTAQTIGFDYGWGFYNGNTLLRVLQTGTKDQLASQYYLKVTETLSFGSNITSGTYRIIPIYSEIGAYNWRPCVGSDVNYIEVTIQNNNCYAATYGNSCTPNYSINSCDVSGHMHIKRPVNIKVNMTNNGNTRNDLVYMFVDGKMYSSAYIDVEKGKSDNLEFIYLPDKTGTVYVAFAMEEKPSAYLTGLNITINDMPAASLTLQPRPLNVTDAQNRVITSDRFSVQVNVQNNSTTAYNEDITINLYKHTYGNYGTLVQTKTVPISLAGGQSTRLQFDLDDVMDGWSYFAKTYYYSGGEQISNGGTGTYSIVFPQAPSYPKGDVNGDREVNIADVNAVIDIILGRSANPDVVARADVDKNGEINIADANAIISIILN